MFARTDGQTCTNYIKPYTARCPNGLLWDNYLTRLQLRCMFQVQSNRILFKIMNLGKTYLGRKAFLKSYKETWYIF